MQRPRITIGQSIVFVAIVALALAAIHSASAAWAGALLSITFFAMICSLLGVALQRGMRRTYWIGFAMLGWGYLLLIHAPFVDQRIGVNLLAPNLFRYLAIVLQLKPQPGGGGGGGGFQSLPVGILGATQPGGGFGGWALPPNLAAYQRIGVALEALLWAFAGGWVACYFASRREEDEPTRASRPAAEAESSTLGAPARE